MHFLSKSIWSLSRINAISIQINLLLKCKFHLKVTLYTQYALFLFFLETSILNRHSNDRNFSFNKRKQDWSWVTSFLSNIMINLGKSLWIIYLCLYLCWYMMKHKYKFVLWFRYFKTMFAKISIQDNYKTEHNETASWSIVD